MVDCITFEEEIYTKIPVSIDFDSFTDGWGEKIKFYRRGWGRKMCIWFTDDQGKNNKHSLDRASGGKNTFEDRF